MRRSRSRVVVLAAAMVSIGCWSAHEAPLDLVECEPRVSPGYLFRADAPRPRGRMHACEVAVRTEDALLSRAVALGCPLGAQHHGWSLTGACDYAHARAWWEVIDECGSCAELDEIAPRDPCVRPDRSRYWRPEGD